MTRKTPAPADSCDFIGGASLGKLHLFSVPRVIKEAQSRLAISHFCNSRMRDSF